MLTADDECRQRQWRQSRSMYKCRTAVCTNEVLQHVRTQVDDVNGIRAARTNLVSGNGGRRAACTNVGQPRILTRFCKAYECRRAVHTNEVLQRLRTQVDDVDGRRAACTNVASGNGGRRATCMNVGQRCVPTKFCNTYERRSAVLTAYEQRVRM